MRQAINVNDIMVFFDKKERQSYKMMADIKASLNKEKHQPITIKDFADYYKINQEAIIEVMQANDQVKREQIELKKQEQEKITAIQNREEVVRKQAQLERLQQKEQTPKRFSFRPY